MTEPQSSVPIAPVPPVSSADVREAVRDGVAMMVAYVIITLLLLSLILVFGDGEDFPGNWLRGAVFAAGLGLRGSVVTHYDNDEVSAAFGSATIGFTPLLLFAIAALLTVRIGRRGERLRPTATTREAVIRAALTAGAATVLLVVLGLLCRTGEDTLAATDGGGQATVGLSISASLLFSLPLLFLGFVGGRLQQRWRAQGRSMRSAVAARTSGVAGWFMTTALHAVLSSVVLTIAFFVYSAITSTQEVQEVTHSFTSEDIEGFVLFGYALPNLALAATGFFQGFSIGAGGYIGGDGGGGSAGLLSGHVPAQHYLWALLVLASAVVVGTRRAFQTPHATVQSDWWRAGLGSLAFWGLANLLLQVRLGGGALSAGIGYTAATLVPLGFGWGVLMVVAGRYLAPRLPGLATRVRVLEEPVDVDGTTVEAVAVPAAPVKPIGKGTIALVIAVVGLLVIGLAGYRIADTKLYGPEKTAQAYLDDIAAGNTGDALDQLLTPPTDRVLLTSAALPAKARILSPHVESVERHGRTATVHVTYLVGATSQRDELLLTQHGRRAGLFHDWKVASELGSLHLTSFGTSLSGLTINGISVGSGEDHPAFPGVYELGTSDPLLGFDNDRLEMTFDSKYQDVQPKLSSSAEELAKAAVVRYLTTCLSGTKDLNPPCGFHSYAYGTSYEHIRWELVGEPDLRIDYEGGRIRVSSTGQCEAHVTGTAVQAGYFGSPATRTPIDETVSGYVYGTVTITDGKATFLPQ